MPPAARRVALLGREALATGGHVLLGRDPEAPGGHVEPPRRPTPDGPHHPGRLCFTPNDSDEAEPPPLRVSPSQRSSRASRQAPSAGGAAGCSVPLLLCAGRRGFNPRHSQPLGAQYTPSFLLTAPPAALRPCFSPPSAESAPWTDFPCQQHGSESVLPGIDSIEQSRIQRMAAETGPARQQALPAPGRLSGLGWPGLTCSRPAHFRVTGVQVSAPAAILSLLVRVGLGRRGSRVHSGDSEALKRASQPGSRLVPQSILAVSQP
jgi:hypothetical protein